MRADVTVYLEKENRVNWQAETHLDRKHSMLVILVPVENNQTIFIKFKEKKDRSPVLVLNLPEIPDNLWGKAKQYFSWLQIFFEWYYAKKMPDPILRSFKGQHFYDWKPNDSNLMRIYLYDENPWSEAKINNFILGTHNEKEEKI